MREIFLGLGSNLGEKKDNIFRALSEISAIARLENISSLFQTAPWGETDQEDFLNAVVEINFEGSAPDLLQKLQDIEKKLGRKKTKKWGPRIIDLDILFFGSEKITTKDLVVPHPFWQERDFVLFPLAEIAPDFFPPDSDFPLSKIAEVFFAQNPFTGHCFDSKKNS